MDKRVSVLAAYTVIILSWKYEFPIPSMTSLFWDYIMMYYSSYERFSKRPSDRCFQMDQAGKHVTMLVFMASFVVHFIIFKYFMIATFIIVTFLHNIVCLVQTAVYSNSKIENCLFFKFL